MGFSEYSALRDGQSDMYLQILFPNKQGATKLFSCNISTVDKMYMNSAFDGMASLTVANRRAELNNVTSSTGAVDSSSMIDLPMKPFLCQ